MDVPIKVIKNFISSEEADVFIEYIDNLEQEKLDLFSVYKTGSGDRLALQIGIDKSHDYIGPIDLEAQKIHSTLKPVRVHEP